ncbi:hypothetical protein [Faecalimicrobium sp. JNUCC 81]
MLKKISVLCLSLVFSLILITPHNVFAIELKRVPSSNIHKIVEENDKFIRIEDDYGITIIYKDLLESNYNPEEDVSEITPRMARYKVKDKKYLGEYIDYNKTLKTVSGNSGVTLQLGFSDSISASVSTTFGVSKSDISAQLGFNVNRNYTVSHSGTYKVPSNVKRAVLKAHPLYDKYQYSIYLRGRMGLPDTKMKTGHALKPIGVHYEKILRK